MVNAIEMKKVYLIWNNFSIVSFTRFDLVFASITLKPYMPGKISKDFPTTLNKIKQNYPSLCCLYNCGHYWLGNT